MKFEFATPPLRMLAPCFKVIVKLIEVEGLDDRSGKRIANNYPVDCEGWFPYGPVESKAPFRTIARQDNSEDWPRKVKLGRLCF